MSACWMCGLYERTEWQAPVCVRVCVCVLVCTRRHTQTPPDPLITMPMRIHGAVLSFKWNSTAVLHQQLINKAPGKHVYIPGWRENCHILFSFSIRHPWCEKGRSHTLTHNTHTYRDTHTRMHTTKLFDLSVCIQLLYFLCKESVWINPC